LQQVQVVKPIIVGRQWILQLYYLHHIYISYNTLFIIRRIVSSN